MRSQLYTLHTPIVVSWYPDAKYSPFGENTTLVTLEEWSVRVLIRSPLSFFLSPFLFDLFFSSSFFLNKLSLPLLLDFLVLSSTKSPYFFPHFSCPYHFFNLFYFLHLFPPYSFNILPRIFSIFYRRVRSVSSLYLNFFELFIEFERIKKFLCFGEFRYREEE